MDMPPDYPPGKSPRRELQGPRPTPLKVRKDSHKISKKPPVAPSHHHQHPQPPQQHRPPVIIYTVSPKVIHTDPSEFMTLVQRLTGSSSSTTTAYHLSNNNCGGAISPAARYASIEKTKTPLPSEGSQSVAEAVVEMSNGVERNNGLFPGILSPGPSSLPPIPPNFFSPPSDSFFHDLSPVLYGNKNYMEGSFMPSPSTFFSPLISPSTPSLDLFNNFLDF